jgi:hypothetical protein
MALVGGAAVAAETGGLADWPQLSLADGLSGSLGTAEGVCLLGSYGGARWRLVEALDVKTAATPQVEYSTGEVQTGSGWDGAGGADGRSAEHSQPQSDPSPDPRMRSGALWTVFHSPKRHLWVGSRHPPPTSSGFARLLAHDLVEL